MYQLKFLELAKNDFDNIINYVMYDLNNKTAAENLIMRFEKELNYILEYPYWNSTIQSSKGLDNNYRKTKVKNYYIFYTIDEGNKTIIIVRVIYIKRNIDKLLTN